MRTDQITVFYSVHVDDAVTRFAQNRLKKALTVAYNCVWISSRQLFSTVLVDFRGEVINGFKVDASDIYIGIVIDFFQGQIKRTSYLKPLLMVNNFQSNPGE